MEWLLKYARREKKDFPPSSLLGKEGNQVQQIQTTPITASLPAAPIIDNEIKEAGSSEADVVMREARAESETPEPDTLARKIQAMVASSPSIPMPSAPSTPFPQFNTALTGAPGTATAYR